MRSYSAPTTMRGCPIHPDKDHYWYYAEPYWKDGYFIVECQFKRHVMFKLAELSERTMPKRGEPVTIEQLHPSLDWKAFCLNCKRPGCTLELRRTAYEEAWRNLPIYLCPYCAAEHHRHWDDMWNEYESGLL